MPGPSLAGMDARVRAALLVLFVCGAAGTGVELLLLEHTEKLAQWVPLAGIAASVTVLAAHAWARHRVTVRMFQAVMLGFLAAGGAGVVLHYRGNTEFERERDPDIAGWDLFRRALQGATPALAPGTMVLLGSIGLLYAYKHPALERPPALHPRRSDMNRATTLALVVCAAAAGLGGGGTAHAQVGRSAGVRDANLASEKDLLAVPNVTPAIAQAIVSGRPFASVTSLDALLRRSLGPDQVKQVYGKLFVPVNLNTASREEILLIPGVGDRMLHEFLEYRPYKTLSQFHREIGKYVNDEELARLVQYVFVPVNLNTATDADILSIPGLGPRMLHEFKEYRPYKNIEQFRREIGKYVDKNEVARLERYVTIN